MSDTVTMPKELTAANGAKAALMGEFFVEVQVPCPECAGEAEEVCAECEVCNGDGWESRKVMIEWDTIKDIYRKAVEVCAAAPVAPAEPTHPAGHADCLRCFGTGGVVLAGGKVATCICTTYAAPVAPANQTEK